MYLDFNSTTIVLAGEMRGMENDDLYKTHNINKQFESVDTVPLIITAGKNKLCEVFQPSSMLA